MTDIALADIPMARDLVPKDRRLLPAPLEQLYEVADLLATGGVLVPKAFRGQRELCLGVAYQAALWGTDPVATINKAYVVNDRIAYEAQLINAIVLGHLKDRPNYTFNGAGATRQCRVVATPKAGGEREYTSPQLGQIKVRNSPLWVTDPDQQLSYMSIRAWSRRHMPDVLLGIYAVEELQSVVIRDITPPPADPFADDDAEPEHVEAEEVFPGDTGRQQEAFEPSGGAVAPGVTDEASSALSGASAEDDPLAWAEACKTDAATAGDETSLNALWTGSEANRKALFRLDRTAHDDLKQAFIARQRELRA